MRIYRVENKTGFGPWFNGEIKFLRNEGRGNPLPYEYNEPLQGEPWRLKNYLCGMLEEQIPIWFSRQEQDLLKTGGFELVEYDIADQYVLVGRTQVCFHKNVKRLRISQTSPLETKQK